MKRILKYDWDAIAGIIATVAAFVMHMLHIVTWINKGIKHLEPNDYAGK